MVHVEEPTLKGHYAPLFNSMHIESTKDQIWFRANAAQRYKTSSVESSSVSSRVKASLYSLYFVAVSSIRRTIPLWARANREVEQQNMSTSMRAEPSCKLIKTMLLKRLVDFDIRTLLSF